MAGRNRVSGEGHRCTVKQDILCEQVYTWEALGDLEM